MSDTLNKMRLHVESGHKLIWQIGNPLDIGDVLYWDEQPFRVVRQSDYAEAKRESDTGVRVEMGDYFYEMEAAD